MRATAAGDLLVDQTWSGSSDLNAALERVFDWLRVTRWAEGIIAVGHRIVHGGSEFREPAVLTAAVMRRLALLSPLAPMHQPFNLHGVTAAQSHFPDALQAGAFDTAFHANQPDVARLYALPRDLIEDGVVAYGFHGLSFDYIAGELLAQDGRRAEGRSIVLHLGSGVSLCALDKGQSVATTMGFSALDGPPMSTRCGALDPGVVLYLLQEKGMSADAVTDLLYHRSGLLGLSGLSGDMVALLASDKREAAQALDVYVYRISRQIGSLAAALGGLDAVVFTAGVGENAAPIRGRIGELCGWLGLRLDAKANSDGARCISQRNSAVKAFVIPTDEQIVIARATVGLVGRQG